MMCNVAAYCSSPGLELLCYTEEVTLEAVGAHRRTATPENGIYVLRPGAVVFRLSWGLRFRWLCLNIENVIIFCVVL